MGTRRRAREVALQFLYQLDLQGEDDPVPHEQEFWARHALSGEARTFAETLVRGAKTNQAKIDQVIEQYTENWVLERMAVVDRNILRVAVYEILCTAEVPAKVVINEAIEIAKKFGTLPDLACATRSSLTSTVTSRPSTPSWPMRRVGRTRYSASATSWATALTHARASSGWPSARR